MQIANTPWRYWYSSSSRSWFGQCYILFRISCLPMWYPACWNTELIIFVELVSRANPRWSHHTSPRLILNLQRFLPTAWIRMHSSDTVLVSGIHGSERGVQLSTEHPSTAELLSCLSSHHGILSVQTMRLQHSTFYVYTENPTKLLCERQQAEHPLLCARHFTMAGRTAGSPGGEIL